MPSMSISSCFHTVLMLSTEKIWFIPQKLISKGEFILKRVLLLFLLITLFGCSAQERKPLDTVPSNVEKIATNLESPWSIAKDGDTFFISERVGTIVKITSDGTANKQLVQLSEPLSNASEAGLMGLVLKKDFTESNEAYAYYTYNKDGKPVNRIVVLMYTGTSWIETDILLDDIESGPVHHGGRLAISPKAEALCDNRGRSRFQPCAG